MSSRPPESGTRSFQKASPAGIGRPGATAPSYPISALAFPLLLLLMFMLSCDAGRGETYGETAEIMGTTFSVTIDGHENPSQAAEAAFNEIRRIDRLLSTYKSDSEISEVNRRASSEPVSVGADFWQVALASRRYHELGAGAFDPSVYPLLRMWRSTSRQGRIPTDAELDEALPLVSFGNVVLDESARAVSFGREGMALDFGGIAKGYAVDRAVTALKTLGVTRAIVDAGGNFYALGTPTGRQNWRAGIRHPLRPDEIIATIPVADAGVATSGNYERFFEIGGKKYCHIMDPRTGLPVEGMLSATVIADSATAADALSTSVFVLGEREGIELLEGLPGVEGMLIVQDGTTPEGLRVLISSGLAGTIELLLPVSL